jgi:hypothetical protein
MNKKTQNIPLPIRRSLRQEADFGCCKCGNPIIEYHHILGRNNGHNIEDMMALCPTCHHSIDSYTENNQRAFKRNPYNKSNENQSGNLIISQGVCAVSTGSITLLGDGPLITQQDKTYVSVFVNESDILEISISLYDKDQNLILEIDRNEWKKGDIELWDIEFISASKILKIREKKGKINLEINASQVPVIIKGDFWIDGDLVLLSQKGIKLNNKLILESDNGISHNKFGKSHLLEGAFTLSLKGKFSGGDYYSGCFIELNKEKQSLDLKPKPQPFYLDTSSKDECERLLLQQIKTQNYFTSNITLDRDFNELFFSGMEVVKEEISLIPFIQQLARFYAKTNQIPKALKQYEEILKAQYNFFQKPNKEQGETFFELARLFMHLRDLRNAKESFQQAVICFLESGFPLPFRFLDFSKNLYQDNDICYCNSGKTFENVT